MKTGLLTVCLLASITGVAGNAQTIRASIYGRVMDASQAPVPNATVQAIHVATNSETVYVTDQAGEYDFPRLVRFGEYRLEVEASKFRKLVRDGIMLVIDQRARVDLQLELGSVTQAVTVESDATQLETSNSTPGA